MKEDTLKRCSRQAAMIFVAFTVCFLSTHAYAQVTGHEKVEGCYFASADRAQVACVELYVQPGGEGGFSGGTRLNFFSSEGKSIDSYDLATDYDTGPVVDKDAIRRANTYMKAHGFTKGKAAQVDTAGSRFRVLDSKRSATVRGPSLEAVEPSIQQCCKKWNPVRGFIWPDGFVIAEADPQCNWEASSGPCHWEETDPPVPPPAPAHWFGVGRIPQPARLTGKETDLGCLFASADRSEYACLRHHNEEGTAWTSLEIYTSRDGKPLHDYKINGSDSGKRWYDSKVTTAANRALVDGGFVSGVSLTTTSIKLSFEGMLIVFTQGGLRAEVKPVLTGDDARCCPKWSSATTAEYFADDGFLVIDAIAECQYQSDDESKACWMGGGSPEVRVNATGRLSD